MTLRYNIRRLGTGTCKRVFAFGTFILFICGKESAMKIENSHVNMASSHNSYSYTHIETVTIEQRANVDTLGAVLKLSEEGEKSYKESLEQLQKNEEEAAKKRKQLNNMKKTKNRLARISDRKICKTP